MKNKYLSLMFLLLLQGACSSPSAKLEPPPSIGGVAEALAYRQALVRMSASDLAREQVIQARSGTDPDAQMRLALLLTQPRHGASDPGRALSLLEAILKNNTPEALALHPLARLLAEQLQERLRQEAAQERLNGQLRESQRRVQELQEKIDRLAEIERSLPKRPMSITPGKEVGR